MRLFKRSGPVNKFLFKLFTWISVAASKTVRIFLSLWGSITRDVVDTRSCWCVSRLPGLDISVHYQDMWWYFVPLYLTVWMASPFRFVILCYFQFDFGRVLFFVFFVLFFFSYNLLWHFSHHYKLYLGPITLRKGRNKYLFL